MMTRIYLDLFYGKVKYVKDVHIRLKTFKSLLLWNRKADDLEVGMRHWLLEYYQVCSNDDPGLTLTYFTAK